MLVGVEVRRGHVLLGWAGLVMIVLDACGDGIVWLRHATGPTRESDDYGVAPGVHFAARVHHGVGPRLPMASGSTARPIRHGCQPLTAVIARIAPTRGWAA